MGFASEDGNLVRTRRNMKGTNMPKPKTIKLNKADRKEADRLQREVSIARWGVETANHLHYEAGERLWRMLWDLHPGLEDMQSTYFKGIITVGKPKENKP